MRKVYLNTFYENENISNIGLIEQFTYTDEACNNSDSISITVDNIDSRWQNGWQPKKSDNIRAKIMVYEDNKRTEFNCGDFIVDDFSINAPPMTCNINAISVPINNSFTTEPKSKIWKKVSLRQIALEIAGANNIELIYDAQKENKIEELEQSKETDSSFLAKLCKDYNLQMKIYSKKIIIYDETLYENKDSVFTITPQDCSSWTYNATTAGTYTGAVISYTSPKQGKTITVNVGTTERLLYINEPVKDEEEARIKAQAKIKEANKDMTTMSITLKVASFLVATNNIDIKNFGNAIDGKYFIKSVSHTISDAGYVVNAELRKISSATKGNTDRKKGDEQSEKQEDKETSKNYTVKRGDNLWDLARKFYGAGKVYKKIYEANKDVIEQVARSRGKKNSQSGKWIFPGTNLVIP